MYVAAAVFALAGESAWALRLSVAMVGLVLIPALYVCARVLFPARPVAAIIAAFIAATLYWTLNLSRIGWPTHSLAVATALSAASLFLAYRTRAFKWAVIA